jgi:NTP pyrophosphatase (non-canonical NTP hydrolase)
MEALRLRDELASVRMATIEAGAQAKMGEWVRSRLGDNAMRAHERGMRFLEESLELAQAVGVGEVSVMNLTRFVFSRDKGVVAQEIGGVGTTLLALSESQGIPMMEAIQAEIDRIYSLPMEKFRKRQQLNAEAGIGALPIRALAEGGSKP